LVVARENSLAKDAVEVRSAERRAHHPSPRTTIGYRKITVITHRRRAFPLPLPIGSRPPLAFVVVVVTDHRKALFRVYPRRGPSETVRFGPISFVFFFFLVVVDRGGHFVTNIRRDGFF